jgi:sulfate adenylyltransferase
VTIDLISPYGGQLVDLSADALGGRTLSYAASLPSIRLSARTMCDLELLATGAFSPLDRFMGEADYHSVLDGMRLRNGTLFPLPIVLPIPGDSRVEIGMEIGLRTEQNQLLATMQVAEKFRWELEEAAIKLLGKFELRHPLVAEMHRWGTWFISGELHVLRLPPHYDFLPERLTPVQTRQRLVEMGYSNVVAYQTRNPLHLVHEELTRRAIESVDGVLFLHPIVGLEKAGDVDFYNRIHSYQTFVARHFDKNRVLLSILPFASRFAGPRETVMDAIMRRNFGATHLIIGRNHASPLSDRDGSRFFDAYAAQNLFRDFSDEIGVKLIPFRTLVHAHRNDQLDEFDRVPRGAQTASITRSQLQDAAIQTGRESISWFTRQQSASYIAQGNDKPDKLGVCVWLIGLHGSGKSSTAAVLSSLLQKEHRTVTLLDSDVLRTNLGQKLGYSRADRETHIRHIGFIASEIVRHEGIVVCVAVSPYRSTRNEVRAMVGTEQFVEVWIDAPIDAAEKKDEKGFYQRARRGEIDNFAGIDVPFESPHDPELRIDALENSAETSAQQIFNYLVEHRFVKRTG